MTSNNCWLWARWIRPDGYGQLQVFRKNWLAHRFMYVCLVGEIPNGLELDHLCRVRHCVNPAHLEPVTREENLRRGEHYQQSKTHCAKGHLYNELNTYRAPSKPEKRLCKKCRADYQRSLRGYSRRYKLREWELSI